MRFPIPPRLFPVVALSHAVALSGALAWPPAAATAAPLQFANPLDQSVWQLQSGSARCLLRHPIADYGHAEFRRESGRALTLRLPLPKAPVQTYQATLRSVPPAWNHRDSGRPLGSQPLDPTARDFVMEGAAAQTLLEMLERGLNVEVGFGPVGGAAQAVVTLSAVRIQMALPDFRACVAALQPAAPPPARLRPAAKQPTGPERAARRPQAPAAARPVVIEDPYIRTDVIVVGQTPAAAASEPKATPHVPGNAGAVLGLVDELTLNYTPDQNELSDRARIELGSFAREYLAQRRRDVMLIAGSPADGPLTRRRALEIKGYLVRTGLPATHVLIHVPGEKLPQRDGQTVAVPDDATRMMVWRVR